jgi:ribonuclease HI
MVKQMKGIYKVRHPGLLPLWQQARKLAAQLAGFEMRHTLRGGNKEADQLANDAMDQGTGKRKIDAGASAPPRDALAGTGKPAPVKKPAQVIEGLVKGGVVHPLEGELPDGIIVKIVRD